MPDTLWQEYKEADKNTVLLVNSWSNFGENSVADVIISKKRVPSEQRGGNELTWL